MDVYLRHLLEPEFFVVLIHPTVHLQKRYTLVKLSTDPLRTVVNLNPRSGGPLLYKLRAGCAFRTYQEADRVRHFLATKKRSFQSKQKYLKKLAEKYNLRYYSDKYSPPGGTRNFLLKHAPLNYVQTYDRLISKKAAR
jgi:hypothetical protein